MTRKFRARRKYSIIRKCQLEKTDCPIDLDSYETRIIKILTDKDGNLLPVNEFTDEMMKLQVILSNTSVNPKPSPVEDMSQIIYFRKLAAVSWSHRKFVRNQMLMKV